MMPAMTTQPVRDDLDIRGLRARCIPVSLSSIDNHFNCCQCIALEAIVPKMNATVICSTTLSMLSGVAILPLGFSFRILLYGWNLSTIWALGRFAETRRLF